MSDSFPSFLTTAFRSFKQSDDAFDGICHGHACNESAHRIVEVLKKRAV